MPLHVQIASDLHIEFYKDNEMPEDIVVPKAPVLALLGDIGMACTEQLRDFLYKQADRFETVLFVVGNHEYYNSGSTHTVKEQMEWMQQVCQGRPNLHLLENQAIELNGVRILGTALWTKIPTEMHFTAARVMNDYQVSYTINKYNGMLCRLSPSDTCQWHENAVAWLEQEIEKCRSSKQPVLVLTHHTPYMVGTSSPEYDESPALCFASTDLSRLLQPPVRAWCSGHTHYNYDFAVNGTRLVSNQRGYAGELTDGYDPSRVLEIE